MTQPDYVVGKQSGSQTLPSTTEFISFGASYVGEMVLGNTFLLTVESLRGRLLRKLAPMLLGNEALVDG